MKSSSPSHLRGWVLGSLLSVGLSAAPPVWAQPSATAPAPATASGGTIQQQTKPFYLEAALVVLFMGGAVFVVCRGSRR